MPLKNFILDKVCNTKLFYYRNLFSRDFFPKNHILYNLLPQIISQILSES